MKAALTALILFGSSISFAGVDSGGMITLLSVAPGNDDSGADTITAYLIDTLGVPTPGNDSGGLGLPAPGNDSGGMVTLQSLRYLSETDSSVVLQINDSLHSFEIEDQEILKAPGLEDLVRESMEQDSWISVN